MRFRVDEISSVIGEEIQQYRQSVDLTETGKVLEVGDGIAQVYGLQNAKSGELIAFSNGSMGQVFNLEESSVGIVILGEYLGIKEGDEVRRTGELVSVPCGEAMIGRIVDPLGRPLDGLGVIETPHRRPLEFKAPGIAQRQPVTEPLQTGLKAIDSMIPIGRGQRELIIGDRKTGKTAIAIDAIINQKGAGVSASSADPAPLQYIAPYAGAAMAEYFMYQQGKATLCIYDDLSKQAASYRQLSLLLRRPPGREAYPGDVFYLHSRLLERSVKLRDEYGIVPKDAPADLTDRSKVKKHPQGLAAPVEVRPDDEIGLYHRPHGKHTAEAFLATLPDKDKYRVHRFPDSGGSMTALPIIETLEGEVSAYIPTNVISITDGQIYLEPDLFFAGVRPAVNVGISVSRVGGNAQRKAMKKFAGSLRLDLASFRALEAFSQLGTDLDTATQKQLDRGKRMVELLKQPQFRPLPTFEQVISIFAGTQGVLDEIPVAGVLAFETAMLAHVRHEFPEILQEMEKTGDLPEALAKKLLEVLNNFRGQYLATNLATAAKRPA